MNKFNEYLALKLFRGESQDEFYELVYGIEIIVSQLNKLLF